MVKKIDWDELERKKRRSLIKFVFYIAGFIFILLAVFGCFYTVSAGERAVLLTKLHSAPVNLKIF